MTKFWNRLSMGWQLFTLFASFAIVIFLIGYLFATIGAHFECLRYGWATDRETKVTLGVCYVKTDSGWYEKSQLRSQE